MTAKQLNKDRIEKNKVRRRESRRGLKVETFKAYGGVKCACPGGCNVKYVEHLTLDHMNGSRKKLKHRKKDTKFQRYRGRYLFRLLKRQGFPHKDKLRVLCWNCNCSLGVYGYCPHSKS